MDATLRCPCGSGDTYGDCCARLHSGALAAPSADALMRSRYTAFVAGDSDYLSASWHPSTRPPRVEVDDENRWTRLEILDTVEGGPFDHAGVVEFRAHYRRDGVRGVLHERSRFVRENGRWLYLDGTLAPS